VRAVAARVAGLGALESLLPNLRDALVAEPDAATAREEIRSVCSLGGPAYDDVLLAAAKRFAPRLDADVVQILARMRGMEALPLYFETLRTLSLSAVDRQAFFRIAARGRKDVLFVAGSFALGREDAESWKAILAVAAEKDAALNEAVVLQALQSKNAVFRGETAWYLARTRRGKTENAPELLQALSQAPARDSAASDPELRFGAEMLRRVLGQAPVEDEAWLACLETNPDCHLDSDLVQSPLVEYLTERERDAVRRRNRLPGTEPPIAESGAPTPTRTPMVKPRTTPTLLLRQITGLPIGVARDLFASGGCKSGFGVHRLAAAAIEFRADGLPRHVTLELVPEGSACRAIAETLFLLSTAPSGPDPVSEKTGFVAFFDPECLVCSEEEDIPTTQGEGASEVRRVRGEVTPPKLFKKPEPSYPEAARKSGIEGVAVYEAIISRTGCPRDIRVLRSTHPLLDVSGMEAITRWRYTPATLNGRPVRVYLTVTVTFRLRR